MTFRSRVREFLVETAPATASADPSSITLDRTFEARTAQLAAARDAATARLAELRAQAETMMRVAEREHSDATNALANAARTTHAALRASIVRDAQSAFDPLVTQWRDAPSRQVATQIFKALVTLVRREMSELGPVTSYPHALLALTHSLADHVAQTSPCVLVSLAHGAPPDRWVSAYGALMHNAVLPALDGTLITGSVLEGIVAELEASAEALAASNRGRPLEPTTAKRWALVRAQDPDALQAFDAEVSRQRSEQAAADYHAALSKAEKAARARQHVGAATMFE